jgi:stress-induced morphogen
MVVEKLTTTLINDFNPKFLAYDTFDNSINIVIASDCFINQSMPDRVRSVYKCVEEKCPEILENHFIFVHSFTEDELLDVLEHNEEGI